MRRINSQANSMVQELHTLHNGSVRSRVMREHLVECKLEGWYGTMLDSENNSSFHDWKKVIDQILRKFGRRYRRGLL